MRNEISRCSLVGLVLTLSLAAQKPLAERVDEYLEPLVEMGMFSGAVLLAKAGDVLVEQAYGFADHEQDIPNTVDTRFKLMSTSKTFTGVLVMQLVEAGELALADPVGKHLPDWPAVWEKVTVHDLLDHTSGIPNLEIAWSGESQQGEDRGLAVWLRFAKDAALPLVHEPGTNWRYSNFNTVLAGCVVEAATGEVYADLVRERVLAPAKLMATGLCDGQRHDGLAIGYFRARGGGTRISEQNMSHIQAAGGLYSTVRDLYRYDRALYDDTLLGAAARERMVTPKHGTYACCWFTEPVHGHACIGHSGGANGYVADLLRFPDDDACVVVLSNYAFAPIGRLSSDLAALLFEVDYEVPKVATAAELNACAGVYQWGEGHAHTVLRRSGRSLMAFGMFPGNDRIGGRMLIPLGDYRFREAFGPGILTVENDHEPARIRRRWGEGEGDVNLLPRVTAGHEQWRPVVLQGARISAEITAEDGTLWLRFADSQARAIEIVPVTSTLALALVSSELGTPLRREGDVLRLTRMDGSVLELRPK